jgi:predicted phosphodiesterase
MTTVFSFSFHGPSKQIIQRKQQQQRRRRQVKTTTTITTIGCFSLGIIGMLAAVTKFGVRFSIRSKSKVMMETSSSLVIGTTRLYEGWDAPLPPHAPGTVRCVILSDTHGEHEAVRSSSQLPLQQSQLLPKGDVLIHLGDVADRGNLNDIRSFRQWIQQEEYRDHFRHIVIIEGNHDRELLELNPAPKLDLELEYKDFIFLRDQVVEVAGITMLGVSWDSLLTPVAPNLPMAQVKNAILQRPPNSSAIDMVLSHMYSPTLEEIVPSAPVHLFGHFHRQRGIIVQPTQSENEDQDDGSSGDDNDGYNHHNHKFLVNCASIPYYRPVVLDWNLSTKQVAMIHCPI